MVHSIKRKWRVALVGCGFFADNHLYAWKELGDRVELVAVCDLDQSKVESAGKRFGVKATYTDFEAMLSAERPDFVDIVTTAPSHLALMRICAKAKVPAIVQKPIAPDWQSATALVDVMQSAGQTMMVHENFRFQSVFRRTREILREGAIGDLVFGRFASRSGIDIYAGQPYLAEVERLVILDLGIHVLDIARTFMGEVKSVYCQTQSVRPDIAGEDMATIMLAHESGATSIVEVSYASKSSPDPFPQTLGVIEGRTGSIRLEDRYQIAVTTGQEAWRETAAPEPGAWRDEPWILAQESVLAAQRHWLDQLDAGLPPETDGTDNLKTFALVEAAYLSAETGQVVPPKSWG